METENIKKVEKMTSDAKEKIKKENEAIRHKAYMLSREPIMPHPEYDRGDGLSKREYFAGLAMQAMLQALCQQGLIINNKWDYKDENSSLYIDGEDEVIEYIAHVATDAADAMCKYLIIN